MGGPSYTVEQLHKLRESPLVQKPDGLPSIEQWMDLPQDQNTNRRPRSGVIRDGEAALAPENRADRPLINPMGHFARRSSTHVDDTVLGPPKLSFTSASRGAKAAENHEKRTSTLEGDQLGDRFPARERWTRDRDTDRSRDKAGHQNGRRTAREEGEGWTNVKSRKSLGQEDFDRGFGRNGDRDRERTHKEGDADNADSSARRTGAGRDKFERWGRRDETGAKEGEGNRFGGTSHGGWRDRERDRERDKDRDWTRGNTKTDDNPEWMDAPVDMEKKQARTQEDFQRWKEQMNAKKKGAAEPEEREKEGFAPQPSKIEEHTVNAPMSEEVKTTGAPRFGSAEPETSSNNMTPMGLESEGKFFGTWAKEKTPEAAGADAVFAVKAKKKQSKFVGLFQPAEKPSNPIQTAFSDTPASPGPKSNGSNDEDKEGFQRILQMLGGTNIAAPSSQAAQASVKASANGARHGGMPLNLPLMSPPEQLPENMSPPQQQPPPRNLEQRSILENILAPRPSVPDSRPFNTISPEPDSLHEPFRLNRPDSNRPGDEFPIQQPPSRNSSAHDAHLHALINGRATQGPVREKQSERDFLLTLMREPRGTPPQLLNQNMPRPPQEHQNLPPFFDQGSQRPQAQPKGRGLPPGFMEDPRMFAENEMLMRREAIRDEERRAAAIREQVREQQLRDAGIQQQENVRKANQRLPPGIFHDDPGMAGLQRRNTAGEIPRQMTNMGIPSQPVQDMPPYMRGNIPPTPQERNIGPPPGFGNPAGMRQPPGFGGPQGGPQQMGPFSAGNTPLGHPPGMGPNMGNMPPNMRQPNMQGPPQGYFPPPGFGGPPMGMQGRNEDPRMMMGRPDFDQYVGQGQPGPPRNVGRPGNMY